jgi:endophilin-A
MPISQPQAQPSVNLINNFNNNMRNQTSGYPHCVAIYDFEAENAGELSFKVKFLKPKIIKIMKLKIQENDVIRLLNRVDDNWYEGMVNGRTGYIPQSYVNVKIPLP